MKKILVIAITVIYALSLSACGKTHGGYICLKCEESDSMTYSYTTLSAEAAANDDFAHIY